MKIAACADLHITDKQPRYRKDNYFETCLNKFNQILDIAEEHKAVIFVAGDFFDSDKTSYTVVNKIIDYLNKITTPLINVPGQHDYIFHNPDLIGTPFENLTKHNKFYHLKNKEVFILESELPIIGAGWDQKPEQEADILLTHQMVTQNKPLYPGQDKSEYSTAKQVMKKYPWAKYIISGDNHESFMVKTKTQTLINCGSMLRKRKDQMEHEPCVYLIDTETDKIKKIKLKIKPAKDVFDLDKIKRDEVQEINKEEANEDIDRFIDSLDSDDIKKPDFDRILLKVIKKTKPDQETKDIINQIMEEVK